MIFNFGGDSGCRSGIDAEHLPISEGLRRGFYTGMPLQSGNAYYNTVTAPVSFAAIDMIRAIGEACRRKVLSSVCISMDINSDEELAYHRDWCPLK